MMQAPQQPNPELQQGEGERDYEGGGTLTGVQNLHTKDNEEETVQPADNRQLSFAQVIASS